MTQSPAGDTPVIPVRITEIAEGASLGTPAAAPAKTITTEYQTVVVNAANPVRPVLPAVGPGRRRVQAVIMVAALIGNGASNSAYGWLADTEAKAATAARVSDGSIGAYITASNTDHTPFTTYAQNAMWVAQDSGSGTAMTLTVIADYEDDAG